MLESQAVVLQQNITFFLAEYLQNRHIWRRKIDNSDNKNTFLPSIYSSYAKYVCSKPPVKIIPIRPPPPPPPPPRSHFRVAFCLCFKARSSVMKMSFTCKWMKTHFHMKGLALSLSLKQRKWSIETKSMHGSMRGMSRFFAQTLDYPGWPRLYSSTFQVMSIEGGHGGVSAKQLIVQFNLRRKIFPSSLLEKVAVIAVYF